VIKKKKKNLYFHEVNDQYKLKRKNEANIKFNSIKQKIYINIDWTICEWRIKVLQNEEFSYHTFPLIARKGRSTQEGLELKFMFKDFQSNSSEQ
jgi:hypothetical protein